MYQLSLSYKTREEPLIATPESPHPLKNLFNLLQVHFLSFMLNQDIKIHLKTTKPSSSLSFPIISNYHSKLPISTAKLLQYPTKLTNSPYQIFNPKPSSLNTKLPNTTISKISDPHTSSLKSSKLPLSTPTSIK